MPVTLYDRLFSGHAHRPRALLKLPTDPALAAQVRQWLATSTKEVHEGPCAARLNKVFGAAFDRIAERAALRA